MKKRARKRRRYAIWYPARFDALTRARGANPFIPDPRTLPPVRTLPDADENAHTDPV